ncbi:TatD family hydrolase [Janibacter cremeus]|uniref:TatD family hydrolase n=1 Tax=Janibacter cremeus TaxID=1285192 RepID=UPI0023F61C8E|nr:TatD family hydrolase [Janibacter cremeus]WEV76680.1 TatD family hydrolase [Janibacter cremeus]
MGGRGVVPARPDPLPVAVVDNHTHLDIRRRDVPDVIAPDGPDERTTEDVAAALAEAATVGVDRVVQVGCDLEGARFTVDQVDRHPSMLGAIALHPNEVPALAEAGQLQAAWDEIERLSAHPRIRAIGESGLDHFRTGPEGHAVQEESFRWHIDLAKRTGKPLQIHDRDSHDDVLRVLAEEGAPEVTVLHCFSGDVAMARECIDRGYLLSFAGTVTFKSARDLREALAIAPLDQVLAETDAPYLTPAPERGNANAPYLLPHTVRGMAQARGVDVPTMCRALSDNAARVYGAW